MLGKESNQIIPSNFFFYINFNVEKFKVLFTPELISNWALMRIFSVSTGLLTSLEWKNALRLPLGFPRERSSHRFVIVARFLAVSRWKVNMPFWAAVGWEIMSGQKIARLRKWNRFPYEFISFELIWAEFIWVFKRLLTFHIEAHRSIKHNGTCWRG